MTRTRLVVAALVVLSLVPLAGRAFADANTDLERARASTERFVTRVAAAEQAGYGLFRDAAGLACIAQPGLGAMGVHYVNGGLVGDAVLDPAAPEALVYEPGRFGQLRLAAVEYIVLEGVWEAAGHTSPPTLFGVPFDFTPSPNRYGIPAFYALHAWIWKDNPAGIFMPWNPRVTCP
jgi:hypothetical protein